jgi:hypothetical protein
LPFFFKKNNAILNTNHTCINNFKAPNGKIIIHGGSKLPGGNRNVKVTPDIAVLNTETEPFEWTVPSVLSNVGEVPSLAAHTANLVGNYMIAAFGKQNLLF